MLPCYGVCSVDAVAHLYAVEVDFHDAVFAPDGLDEDGEVDFEAFAHPAAGGPEEDVLGCLLADGAASALAAAGDAVSDYGLELVEVEAVVLEEELVFAGHDGYGHVEAHVVVEADPVVLEADLFAAAYLLAAADDHEWCDVDGAPLEYNN